MEVVGEYVLGSTLSQSAPGLVRLGRRKDGSSRVVVKEISLDCDESENESLRREVEIMSLLQSKHVVSLLNSYEQDDKLYIVMNYAEHGDMFKVMKGYKSGRIPTEVGKKWFAQIALGVEYLHSQGIVHMDLKPDNVFLTAAGDVIIGDFGRSVEFDSTRPTLPAIPGTVHYAPPEALYSRAVKRFYNATEVLGKLGIVTKDRKHPKVIGPQLDVWALGATLYVMLTGNFPFCAKDELSMVQSILLDDPIYPFYLDHECVSLLRGMMCKDPRRRFTLDEVLRHPWIRASVMAEGEVGGGRKRRSVRRGSASSLIHCGTTAFSSSEEEPAEEDQQVECDDEDMMAPEPDTRSFSRRASAAPSQSDGNREAVAKAPLPVDALTISGTGVPVQRRDASELPSAEQQLTGDGATEQLTVAECVPSWCEETLLEETGCGEER